MATKIEPLIQWPKYDPFASEMSTGQDVRSSCRPVLSCPAGQHFNFRPVLSAPQDEGVRAAGRTGEESSSGRQDRTHIRGPLL
jgi:hypothetical protein